MKKLLLSLLILVGLAHGQSLTPKLGLTLGARHQLDWDTIINNNSNILDHLVPGSDCGDATHALGYSSSGKNLTCQAIGGAPGGATTQVQYNLSSAFGADSTFIFNSISKALSINQSFTALQPVIDCMNPTYGCVGDDSTNDSTAIQAAEAAMQAHGGCVVFQAGHTYHLSTAIAVNSGDCFHGISNSVGGFGATIRCVPSTGCFVQASPLSVMSNVDIENLQLLGGTNQIDFPTANQLQFRDLEMTNFTGCGISLVGGERAIFEHIVPVHNGANGISWICTGDPTKSLYHASFPGGPFGAGPYGFSYLTINNVHALGSAPPSFADQWALGLFLGSGIDNSVIHNMTCEFDGSVGIVQFGSGTFSVQDSQIDGIHHDTCGNPASPMAIGVYLDGEMNGSRISGVDPGFDNGGFAVTEMKLENGGCYSSTIENSWFSTSTVNNSTTFGLYIGTDVFNCALIGIRGGVIAFRPRAISVIGSLLNPSNLPGGNGVSNQLGDQDNIDIYFNSCGDFSCTTPSTASFRFTRNNGNDTYEDLLSLNNVAATFTYPLKLKEHSAATGASGYDWVWADTSHFLKFNRNNGGAFNIPGIASVGLSGHATVLASNGIDLVDSGVVEGVIQSGLMAEYRILPSETVGAIVDYSGNGNNATGTVDTAPSIIAGSGGVNFPGTGAIALPSALNSALTVQLYLRFQQPNNARMYAPLFGSAAPCLGMSLANVDGSGILNGGNRMTQYHNTFDGTSYSFGVFNGTGVWTVTMPGTDLYYVNGTNIDPFGITKLSSNSAGGQSAGHYQLGGQNVACYGANTYYYGQIYYALFYNRALSAGEVAQNAAVMTNAMTSRGIINTMPGGNPYAIAPNSIGNGGSQTAANQIVFDGDSITFGQGVTYPFVTTLTLNGGWNVANQGVPSNEAVWSIAEAPFNIDPFISSTAGANAAVVWLGTNDVSGGGQTPGTAFNAIHSYCQQRVAIGWKCFASTMMSRDSTDTNKNLLNALLRQHARDANSPFTLIDIAADPNLGADGASASATYFQDGVHPTQLSHINDITPIVQQVINRAYGNNDFSSATTYTATAAAAVNTTAGTNSANFATITFSATPANCQAGNKIVIAGTTPAGYSGTWRINTRSSTQVTFYIPTAPGNITVQGTGVCVTQQDADTYTILAGSATSPSFTLQTCVGYTGQNIYLKNANTTSPWVLTPFTSSETIDGATSLTMPTASSGNNPVVVLQSQLISAAAAGCVWKRLQ